MLVGAYALAARGFPRATGDLDIRIRRSDANAERVWRALERFRAPLSRLTVEDLKSPDIVFQIGAAPNRIDILTSIDAVDFIDAWPRRQRIAVAVGPVFRRAGGGQAGAKPKTHRQEPAAQHPHPNPADVASEVSHLHSSALYQGATLPTTQCRPHTPCAESGTRHVPPTTLLVPTGHHAQRGRRGNAGVAAPRPFPAAPCPVIAARPRGCGASAQCVPTRAWERDSRPATAPRGHDRSLPREQIRPGRQQGHGGVRVLVSALVIFQFVPPLRPLHPGQAAEGLPRPAGPAGRGPRRPGGAWRRAVPKGGPCRPPPSSWLPAGFWVCFSRPP